MRCLLIGACAAALAGCSLGGHDAEQIVHKDPATVYAAVDSAFSEIADQGNSGAAAERGQVTTIERVANKSLDLNVTIEGKRAMHIHFGFEPEKGGAETRLSGDWEIDQQVLRDSIRKQGGGEAAMPMIPSFALNLAMKKLLTEMAKKIEAGEMLDTSSESFAMASSEQYAATSASERRYRDAIAQQRATAPTGSAAPMMDPDDAARNFMGDR